MQDRAKLRRWAKRLRKHFPGRHPVRVSLVPRERLRLDHEQAGIVADCLQFEKPDRFDIRIGERLTESEVAEALIHEWAHMLRLHMPALPGETDHDGLYWAIYGVVYRWWHGEAT